MRLLVINCVLMACTTAALAEGLRPRRDLHQIKKMIVNTLFSSSEPSGTHTDPLQTKFFKIPGFNDVVIKAVPKCSNPEPTPVYEELPPDSHLGIVGSYLGTRTLNETYNALLGVKNLLTSGILSGKPELLQEVAPVPSNIQVITKPVKPCAAPGLSPLPLEPVRVFVEPPRVPVVPTQYSYKQVNQDGSLTTYSSYLDLENGVRVIDDGKTLPFFIDRVRNIPVRLPVPVSPDVSKIIVSEAFHPSTYSYQQIHQDGRMTSYLGLPLLIRPPGPVIVTETGSRIPPPPIFLMDRIDKVADIASYPKAPIPVAPTLVAMNAAVVEGGSAPVPGSPGYSYSQIDINGGMTTHSDSGVQTMNAADVGGASAPVPGPTGFSYSQMDINGGMTTHSDSGEQTINAADVGGASAPVPGPTGFSYSQMDINGGMTTHSDSGEQTSNAADVGGGSAPVPGPTGYSYSQMDINGGMTTHSDSEVQTMNAADVGGTSAPVPGPTGYSYSQMDINGGMTTHSASENGLPTVQLNAPSVPKRTSFEDVSEPVNVVENKPIPVSTGPFPPNWFSYKQIGNGKITTYTGSGIFEESFGARPAVIVHGMPHPIPPPPHITARMEKVAAGAMYNQPPYLTMPVAVPVPTGFVSAPSVYTIHPQRPVKVPTTPRMNSFLYKHVHRDGSVTSYGSDGSTADEGKTQLPAANMVMPLPQGKVFDSPMYSGPFPMHPVNLNAIKPSTPVSGSYSYKLVNSDHGSYPPVGTIDKPVVDTFAPPSPTRMPSHIQGCMDPDIFNPVVHTSPDASVPLSYSYKQISHSNLDPFLKVNVDDPERGVQNANTGLNRNNQAYPSLPPLTRPTNPFPTVNIVEHKPIGFVNPAPFWSAPIMKMPIPQGPTETSHASSFSYKPVTKYQPLQAPPQQSAVMEYNPSAPSQKSDMPLPQASKRSSPPSSFSYKQVTSQAYQPLPSPPQPTINDMEHGLSGPYVPPPMINNRGSEIQKGNTPSSFSFKQVTREGVYEYTDEFPTGARTNLPPNAPQTIATPMPESPMPIPSRPTPTFNRQDSLANNPIVVQDSSSSSSFSFKSTDSDGSTVKNDGQNSIAVQVEEAAKTEAVSQGPMDVPRMAPVLKESVTSPAPEETAGPVSGQPRPLLRRVVKRVKPVNHRGDIPDDE